MLIERSPKGAGVQTTLCRSVLICWCILGMASGSPIASPFGSAEPGPAFTLTVQLGGYDAEATVGFLAVAEEVVNSELNCQPEPCTIQDAWNVSTCHNGVPVPAPFSSLAAQGFPPISSATMFGVAPAEVGGRRRLRQEPMQGSSIQDSAQQAVVPGPFRPCMPQVDIVIRLSFLEGADELDYNQTKLFFTTGLFLARMQARSMHLEQSMLLNFTDDSLPGTLSDEDAAHQDIFTLDQAVNNRNATSVQFTLVLMGADAKVTNDTVLKALYDLVVDSEFNGGNGRWLTSPNTVVISLKKAPPGLMPPPSNGRRLLHGEVAGARMLTQYPSAPPQYAFPDGALPAMEVVFRAQDVQFEEISAVKDALNRLGSGKQLVRALRSRNIRIDQVALTSFTFQPPANQPNAKADDLVISQRSNHQTKVIIVVAIVVPVCVVGALVISFSIVWWGRLSQRKNGYRVPDSNFSFMSKGAAPNSEFSSDGLEMLPICASTLVREGHPPALCQSLMHMPWSDWKIEPSELTVLTKPDGSKWLLGSGAAGIVYKALRNGVQIVAVKLFKEEVTRGAITSLNSAAHAAQFRQEISILKSCHDRNIVQFIGACLTEGQTSLVTEFMENGDLYRAINSPQGSRYHWYRLQTPDGRPVPNSGMARRVALDVARGLHFLHCRKIVHFDLKSANILLARDFTAKIADVGLAKILHDDVLSTRREVGTFAWAAPEVLLGQRTTEAADIYSFGVLLHELSAQESPRDRHLRRLSVPDEVPLEVNNLMSRCLDVRPENRPTARELVASLSCMPVIPPFASTVSAQPVQQPADFALHPRAPDPLIGAQ